MAHQTHDISTLTDIPPLVRSFATTVGWDVSGTIANPTLRHPAYSGGSPGGIAFTLEVSVSGLNHDLKWTSSNPIVTGQAIARSPVLANPTNGQLGIVQTPTRVHLISMLTPNPYIVVVIEYGLNLYRHLYMGFMSKIGDYGGGEVISGSSGTVGTHNGTGEFWRPDWHTYLFSGAEWQFTRPNVGGVHVDHPDNADKWRSFRAIGQPSNNNPPTNLDQVLLDGKEALGGFGDGILDFYVQKGVNHLGGVSILIPINLYCTVAAPATQLKNTNFVPIGHPTGVRMVNNSGLEAYQQITLSEETWHVFAAMSKRSEITAPMGVGGGSRYRAFETSYQVAYAYRSA